MYIVGVVFYEMPLVVMFVSMFWISVQTALAKTGSGRKSLGA